MYWPSNRLCYSLLVRRSVDTHILFESDPLIMCLGTALFKRNGTSVLSCVRHALEDLFKVKIDRVGSGLAVIWTVDPKVVTVTSGASIMKMTTSMPYLFRCALHWAVTQSTSAQRRMEYDKREKVFLYRVGVRQYSGRYEVFRSPSIGKRTSWRDIRACAESQGWGSDCQKGLETWSRSIQLHEKVT